MWDWITWYVRDRFNVWLGVRLNYATLHAGIRDGGFMLLYAAWLAEVHPDPAVRAEFQQKALAAATTYYARLQYPDGGWYWFIEEAGDRLASQPFMVGLLLEGLIATHQLTQDPTVAQSILRAVEWLYLKGYEQQEISNIPGVRWRSMRYFVAEENFALFSMEGGEAYGMFDGLVRDARSLNQTTIHAFGYAFKLSQDPKFAAWGDEIFAATFGNGVGPGADAYRGLADYRGKEYNQSYRASGRYLVWRAGL